MTSEVSGSKELCPKPPVFVREATGLVRFFSAWDLLFLGFFGFGGAWSIIYAVEYAPLYGGDPVFSLILTAPGILALLGVYFLFQVSMPRSGGDYVFISRILHPAIGFAANFAGYNFFFWFWIGDAAAVFSSQGLAQTLSAYGALTGQQWAIDAAGIFTPNTTFLVGTVAIVIFTLLLIYSARLFLRIQNVAAIISILGLIVMVGLIATTNPTVFARVLNSYATAQGVSSTGGAYQDIAAAGTAYWGGPVPTAPTSGFTFTLVPLWFTVLFWVFASSYMGGELKNPRRNAKISLFGGFAATFIPTIVVLGLAYANLGPDFLTGAGYYASGYAPNPLPVIPNLTLFAALLSNNPLVALFIGIGVIAGFVLVIGGSMMAMSRCFFAYAFDRIAPSFLADVSARWHSPVKSLVVAAIGSEVFLLFLSGVIGPSTSAMAFLLYSYAGLAAIGLLFTFTSIAAIVFPFRKKSLYEQACPVKRKIVGVPLITWLGIISLAYCLLTIGYYSYDYLFYFGAGTLAANLYYPFLGAAGALFLGCMVWYFIIRWYRSKGGLPFEKAFREIPPE
jgi:APA family basic amino acid/polyamine antiporter